MIYLSQFLFITVSFCVLYFEHRRIKTQRGADTLTLFLFIYYIQIVIPLFIFNFNFNIYENEYKTKNFFFDRVLNDLNDTVLTTVNIMSVAFLFLLYGMTLSLSLRLSSITERRNFKYRLIARKKILLIINVVGVISGFYLIHLLSKGEGLLVGYTNLIAFRSLSEDIERDFVNSNLFSLTQSFLFFSFLLLFCHAKNIFTGEIGKRKLLFFTLIFLLAVFCVSRRSFLIPVLLWFMTILLLTGRSNLVAYLKVILPLSILIFWGKDLLSLFSGARSTPVIDHDIAIWQFVIKVVCDIGITNVESFATLLYMNDYVRFGQDHLYSILQRIPDGMLGLDLGLPERIVRISTEIFSDKYQADIPPGFIGQMWLDFKGFGAIIYAVAFSISIFIIEFSRRQFVIDSVSCAVFSLIIFIFCLPLNSGSLDFNFSIDILFFFLMLPFCFKVKRNFLE